MQPIGRHRSPKSGEIHLHVTRTNLSIFFHSTFVFGICATARFNQIQNLISKSDGRLRNTCIVSTLRDDGPNSTWNQSIKAKKILAAYRVSACGFLTFHQHREFLFSFFLIIKKKISKKCGTSEKNSNKKQLQRSFPPFSRVGRCILATCQRWEKGSRARIEETADNHDEVRWRAPAPIQNESNVKLQKIKNVHFRAAIGDLLSYRGRQQNVHAAINRNWQRRIHAECNIHEADTQKTAALKKNPPRARERERERKCSISINTRGPWRVVAGWTTSAGRWPSASNQSFAYGSISSANTPNVADDKVQSKIFSGQVSSGETSCYAFASRSRWRRGGRHSPS